MEISEDKGWTPLACASEAGNINMLQELLRHDITNIDQRDYQGCTPICLAAKNGHTEAVAQLLFHGANPNLRDLQQMTPLWHAAREGHSTIVRLLLESGQLSDVNPRPVKSLKNESEPPLAIAMRNGHQDTAELLARADGIDPFLEVRDEDSPVTVLELAVRGGFDGVAFALLEEYGLGSGNNEESHDAESGSTDDSDDTNSNSNNGSDGGASGKDSDVGDAGSEGSFDDHFDCHTSSSGTASNRSFSQLASKLLVFAAGGGCYRTAQKLLVHHGADVNARSVYRKDREPTRIRGGPKSWNEEGPLHAACRGGHSRVLRLLLDTEGIRPDLRCDYVGSDAETALAVAAERGFVDLVRMLVADGRVDVEGKDSNERTALSHAAEWGREAVVTELLAIEAVDPDSQSAVGHTPLMYALSLFGERDNSVEFAQRNDTVESQAYEGVVRRLLATGCVNLDRFSLFGGPLLCLAAQCDRDIGPLRAILRHIGSDLARDQWSMMLRSAVGSGRADAVQMLLGTRGKLSPGDLEVEIHTALQLAVAAGQESVVQLFLSTLAINPKLTDSTGKTLLLIAAEKGSKGIVEELLKISGMDINAQDDEGWTALCYAASRSAEMLKALVGVPGLDPNLANNRGRTPLSLAAEAGSTECIDILLTVMGLETNTPDNNGKNLLSWALTFPEDEPWQPISARQQTNNRKEIVRRLLAIPEVDPNAADVSGWTPLIRAINTDFSNEFVGLLLTRSDLDVNKGRLDKLNPLALAKRGQDEVTIALLKKHGAVDSEETALVTRPLLSDDSDSSAEEELRKRRLAFINGGTRLPRRERLYKSITRQDLLPLGLQQDLLSLGMQQEYMDKRGTAGVAKRCSICAAIDLDGAFSNRHSEYTGRVIADLGTVDRTWEARNCPLCRLFAAVRPRSLSDSDADMRRGHRLVSLSVTESWLCHGNWSCMNILKDSWIDTMVLAVLAGPAPEETLRSVTHQVDIVSGALAAGLIGRLGSNCPQAKNAVTIPRLSTYGDDSTMNMAKSWIKCCHQNHSTWCNPPELSPVPHFRLIECSTRRIIRVDNHTPPYVALSYVWGRPQPARSQSQTEQPLEQDNLDQEGSGAVEAVIEDAIRVTLALDYEHLWVDRYCVVQKGNESVKTEQLRHMHTVYANAEVTLIAAAGMDASAGLPGAPGGPPRVHQPSAYVSGHALVCIPPDPTLYIRSRSTWATRGWTFQEGMLARRRLFFSPYEISYECQGMVCREALRCPRSVERDVSWHANRDTDPRWMYPSSGLPWMRLDADGTALFDLLAAYSMRTLSLPSDALNAMLGILQLLAEKETRPIYHVCGVPILRLEGPSPRVVKHWSPLDGFINGLCWRLQKPAHRRLGFPSWSWTGWDGVVRGMHRRKDWSDVVDRHMNHWTPINRVDGLSTDISIRTRGQNGGLVSWIDYYDRLRTADDSSKDLWSGQQHILEITASAVTIRLRRTTPLAENSEEWVGTVLAGDRVWEGPFWLTRKAPDNNCVDTVDSPHSGLMVKPYAGIVLGTSSSLLHDNSDTYILVVQEQEQGLSTPRENIYWERIGLLKLENCTLMGGMIERETWRLA